MKLKKNNKETKSYNGRRLVRKVTKNCKKMFAFILNLLNKGWVHLYIYIHNNTFIYNIYKAQIIRVCVLWCTHMYTQTHSYK